MKKINIFIINTLILVFTSILLRILDFSFNVYIANKVGAEALGVFHLLMSVYIFSVTLATSGMKFVTVRIVSEELELNNSFYIKNILKKCLLISLFLGILSGIILFTFTPYICNNFLYNKISYWPIYFLSLCLPFLSMSCTINGYFIAKRKIVKSASSQIIEQSLNIIIAIYLINIFLPNNINYVCLSLALGSLISEIISFIYLYLSYIFGKNSLNKKTKITKRIFKIGFPIAITSYIRSGLSSFKQLLIPLKLEKSGMSAESALTQYGVVNGMVLPILLFPNVIINSISELIIPEFSRYNITKNYNKINKIIFKIFKLTFIFSFCVIGIFLFFSNELSYIIYKNIEIGKFIKILCPLILLIYLDTIIDSILKGLDKQVSVMGCNILDLILSITFIYLLVPVYGIYGYLIVIFISELINFTISIKILINTTNFKFNYFYWIFICILSIIFSYFFINLLPNTFNILSTIIKIIIFIICYLIFILIFSSKTNLSLILLNKKLKKE